ncbi:LamG domain-containing protein [Bacteroidota bacterium]
MKSLTFLFIFLSLILSTTLFSQTIEDYIGYWPLDGNADDLSSNNNDGTNYGALPTNGKDDNPNGALNFDGTNDYIEILETAALEGMAELSISMWIKPNVEINSGTHVFFTKGLGWGLMFNNNGIRFLTVCTVNNGDFTHNITLNADMWYHLVMVYNGSQVEGFIDNYSVGTEPCSGTIQTTGSYNLIIGAKYDNAANFFNGSIDEVMIFDRALTTEEIAALYSPTSSGWQIDGGTIFINDAQVAIGTDNPVEGYNLTVQGKIVTDEVKVTLEYWPDFVFGNNYNLMPLDEVENYITINNHLPNIPSEKEVISNGVNLAEMNASLLQKIEELTLYLIEQNNRIEELEEKVNGE